jgi:hypothetical protein
LPQWFPDPYCTARAIVADLGLGDLTYRDRHPELLAAIANLLGDLGCCYRIA